MRTAIVAIVALLVWQQASAAPDADRARPYVVIRAGQHYLCENGRTTRIYVQITSDADSTEALAHTVMRAALDLFQQHGDDHIAVTLVASRKANDVTYAEAHYAADGLGGAGLRPRVSSEEAYTWRVWVADRVLTADELRIAEAWKPVLRRFVDEAAGKVRCSKEEHRAAVAESLGIPLEDAVKPMLTYSLYLAE